MKKRLQDDTSILNQCISDVSREGILVGGEGLRIFEEEFAAFTGAKYCVGVANGLDAIRLALQAIGVKPGDEVLVPAFTFIATWIAVTELGAVPVPLEVSLNDAGLDPRNIQITSRTKCLIYVHLYGIARDLSDLSKFLKERNVGLIEDCAQSHGAIVNGKKVGNFGEVACYSFYPTKNLGGIGDGGAITTNSQEIASDVRIRRSYGAKMSDKYNHKIVGTNSRLDNLNAYYLSRRLLRLNEENEKRREIAHFYLSEIHFNEKCSPLTKVTDPSNVFHHFVMLVENREEFRNFLKSNLIGTDIHYPIPPVFSEAYSNYLSLDFPTTKFISNHCVSIPIYPWIEDSSIEKIVSTINTYLGNI